jgi:hypothetical protein
VKDPLLLWLPSSTFRVRIDKTRSVTNLVTAGTAKTNSKPWMRLSAVPGLFRQIVEWLSFITFMEIAFVLLQES